MTQRKFFSIDSLLVEKKDGKITGAVSPLLFAQEMARRENFKFNRLARVWLEDERLHQIREDQGLTGHDTLVIGTVHPNDVWLSMWVDTGTGGIPVAMCYQSDKEIIVTPIYSRYAFEEKLTIDQIREIFDHLFQHPEEWNIQQETD